MNWNVLSTHEQLNEIVRESGEQTIMIYKHSTRCSISSAALDRLERRWKSEEMVGVKPYFLDLIAYRSVSNDVAERFNVMHQSPQVLLIQEGKSLYDTSHFGIDYEEIKAISVPQKSKVIS
ncbi:MAG: bacillithiol system redox-active protein YtxJ [Cyclobacteriaceae bacterium]|nr:bacillithiol system redox-active protein YtxJ [Cyclobacteriaceae bacterium HetDA_MAG_MS6]